MNPVTLSFAQAVLKDFEIESFLFDMNCAVLDGSTSLIHKRLMVVDDDAFAARKILIDAELGDELEPH